MAILPLLCFINICQLKILPKFWLEIEDDIGSKPISKPRKNYGVIHILRTYGEGGGSIFQNDYSIAGVIYYMVLIFPFNIYIHTEQFIHVSMKS